MARSLITGHPWRVILLFSVPLLIGNVVQQLYQLEKFVAARLMKQGRQRYISGCCPSCKLHT